MSDRTPLVDLERLRKLDATTPDAVYLAESRRALPALISELAALRDAAERVLDEYTWSGDITIQSEVALRVAVEAVGPKPKP